MPRDVDALALAARTRVDGIAAPRIDEEAHPAANSTRASATIDRTVMAERREVVRNRCAELFTVASLPASHGFQTSPAPIYRTPFVC
jgi:hypothetical protein